MVLKQGTPETEAPFADRALHIFIATDRPIWAGSAERAADAEAVTVMKGVHPDDYALAA